MNLQAHELRVKPIRHADWRNWCNLTQPPRWQKYAAGSRPALREQPRWPPPQWRHASSVPVMAASCRQSGWPCQAPLAARAIKRAAPGLPDALYQAAAIRAGSPRAIINPQPLLVIIRCARRPAEIKKPVRPAPAKIQRHGAAAFDGFGQHFTNRPPKPRDL